MAELKFHPDFLQDITLTLLQERQHAALGKTRKSSRVLEPQAYCRGSPGSVEKSEPASEVKEADADFL
jgi:hypothetical protein